MVGLLILPLCVLVSMALSAVGAYLLGRPFRHALDDPLLGEKVNRHRLRLGILMFFMTFSVSITAGILGLMGEVNWYNGPGALPLMVSIFLLNSFAVMAGDLPARRIIYEETWNWVEYIGFNIRILLGFSGFWLCLMLIPFAVNAASAGVGSWIASLAAFLLLLGWSRNYAELTARIMGARPVQDDSLLAEFGRIIEKSAAQRPDILEIGSDRGKWCNALALPSLKVPKVIMSRTLLKYLDSSEATAIYAHETAHLEQFNAKVLCKLGFMELLLVAITSFTVPLLKSLPGPGAGWFLWAWLPVLIVIMIKRVKGMQPRETEGDLRAVELCGDAEAMIRALQKLYDINHLPRRMAADAERNSSHPSLARRIQSIRQHFDDTTARPADAGENREHETAKPWHAIFLSRKQDHELLLMDNQRVYWVCLPEAEGDENVGIGSATRLSPAELIDQAGSLRSVAFSELMELRLVLRGRHSELKAVDRSGVATTFLLRPEDEDSIQEALNRVDVKLAPVKNPVDGLVSATRLICFGAAICGLLAGTRGVLGFGESFLLLLASLPALATPNRPGVAAIGGIAATAGMSSLLMASDRSWWTIDSWFLLVIVALAGIWCLGVIHVRAKKRNLDYLLASGFPRATAVTFLVLGVPIFLIQLTVIGGDNPLGALHDMGVDSRGTFLMLIAAGAALWTGERWSSRLASVLLLAAGLSHVFLSSEYFLVRVAKDPLTAQAPEPSLQKGEYNVLQETHLSGDHRGLTLSPEGRRFFTITQTAEEEEDSNAEADPGYESTFYIGDFEGGGDRMKALALSFLDDERLLSVVELGDGLELKAGLVANLNDAYWRLALPDLDPGADLRLRADGDRWRLAVDCGEDRTIQISGNVGSDAVGRQVWSRQEKGDHYRYLGTRNRILETVWRGAQRGAPGSWERVQWVFKRFYHPTDIRFLSPKEVVPLGTTCVWIEVHDPPACGDEMVCLGAGPHHTWVWRADMSEGIWECCVRLGSRLQTAWDGRRLAVLQRRQLLVLDPQSCRGVKIPLPSKADWDVAVSLYRTGVALGWHDHRAGQGMQIVLLAAPVAEEMVALTRETNP